MREGLFTGANLLGVFLEDADLRGADLRGADLGGGGYLWEAVHDDQTGWPDGFDVGRATGEAVLFPDKSRPTE